MAEEERLVSQELMDQADAILRPALARQNLGHPLVRLLLEAGSQALASDLATNSEQYAPPTSRPQPYQEELKPQDIIEVARRVELPALPQVAIRLQEITSNPESSAKDVADIISLDPSLSTALLHLVNSAFYNFPSRIDTIARAVAIVGTTQIHALAMGRMVLHMVSDLPPKHFDMDSFWEHSIACGMLAKGLAELRGGDEPERAFLSGMLHDIGKLAVASALPNHGRALAARPRQTLEYEAEQYILGFEHGRFGAIVLRKLDIPYPIVEAVANHHRPMEAKHPGNASLLHVADFMARTLVISSANPPLIPPLSNEAWAWLELDPDDLRPLIGNLNRQLQDMISILTG